MLKVLKHCQSYLLMHLIDIEASKVYFAAIIYSDHEDKVFGLILFIAVSCYVQQTNKLS